MKTAIIKKSNKQARERKVLLGLVEHFIKTGKPVGSHTLQEAGFEDLSSATIRNYFACLEEEGFLIQQHSSGGRIPTEKAYKLYSQENLTTETPFEGQELVARLKKTETREVAGFLQQAAELLTQLTNTAVFLSAPRFDQDFILDIKFIAIDHSRCLGILITDFGVVQTEILHTPGKLSTSSIKGIEEYFQSRLKNQPCPKHLEKAELALAQKFYNELMVRYIVGYANFSNEEIYRTGFSKLLHYPDFSDPAALANSLSLFENAQSMRLLLKESMKINQLKFWIGNDLLSFSNLNPQCAVIAIPYHINQKQVGSIGLLGPMRIPYSMLFSILRQFSHAISEALTQNLFKFKIQFRQPQNGTAFLQNNASYLDAQAPLILLEDKRYP